jgi:hypothetical protein
MTRTRRPRLVGAGWVLALSMASVFVLSACTALPAGIEPTPAAAPSEPAPTVVSIEMPDLAPYPESDPPLTDAESETKRLEHADLLWQGVVLTTYPQAVRPEVAFEGYVTDETRIEVMRACYEAAGLQVEEGWKSPDLEGPPDSIGWSGNGETDVIAGYACAVAHPMKITRPGPNKAELGWIYDYLVTFYAPCLAANGLKVPEPPGRDVLVEAWPEYTWFPTTAEDPRLRQPDVDAALQEACPHPDAHLRTVVRVP